MSLLFVTKSLLAMTASMLSIQAFAAKQQIYHGTLGFNRAGSAACVTGQKTTQKIGKVQYTVSFDQSYNPIN